MIRKAGKRAWEVVKRGNMFMTAIGLVLSISFRGVISSLANDIILNPISLMLGFDDLSKWESNNILIGKFVAALLTFIIIATVVFFLLWFVFIIKAHRDKRKGINDKKAVVEPTTEELIAKELKELNDDLEQRGKVTQ